MELTNIPHNSDAEKALLGSLMMKPKDIYQVMSKVPTDAFYEPKNATIYSAMKALSVKSSPIDLVTVTTELRSMKADIDVDYINRVLIDTPVSNRADYYAKIVMKNATLRNLMSIGYSLIEDTADANESSDTDRIISKHATKLIGIDGGGKEESDISDAVKEFNETQEHFKVKLLENSNSCIGIPTGFSKIDDIIDGLRPGHMILVGGYTSSGKCHAKGTKILMYNGELKNVEDIKVGDMVMGVDSKPRTVLRLAHNFDEMYKVSPLRRESFVVNSEHLLSLKRTGTSSDKTNNRKDDIVNISVKDYINSSKSFKHIHKLWSTSIDFKESELPLDPYIFGYWLGNGTRNQTTISTNETEILQYLNSYCNNNNLRVSHKCNYDYNIYGFNGKNNFLESLRNTGSFETKQIPHNYKINSRDNRLKLLAGLLDSDGSFSNNMFEFVTVKEQVANDVSFTARSLGFHASVTSRSVKTNYSGDKLCTSYRVAISGNIHEIPTIVNRKKAKQVERRTNSLRYGFTVEHVGYGEYFGFELDGDHLYFTENLIVQHNTQFMLNIINAIMSNNKTTLFSLEMSRVDIIARLLSIETGLGASKILRHQFSEQWEIDEYNAAKERLINSGLRIYSQSTMLDDIIMSMTRDIVVNKTKVFAIDYAQLIRTRSSNEYEQITETAQRLQNFARENGVTIIILSQISNEHAKDQNRETMGFKGGGTLPASADLAIELVNTDTRDERAQKLVDKLPFSVNCIVRKNRHGRTGIINFDFYPWNGKFEQGMMNY